jgi:hypothetical protein
MAKGLAGIRAAARRAVREHDRLDDEVGPVPGRAVRIDCEDPPGLVILGDRAAFERLDELLKEG